MKLKLVVTVCALSAMFTVNADDNQNEQVFKLLDKNNDGFITQIEASSVKKLIKDWDSIDTDKNGDIALSEFSKLKSAEAYTPVEAEDEPIGAAPAD